VFKVHPDGAVRDHLDRVVRDNPDQVGRESPDLVVRSNQDRVIRNHIHRVVRDHTTRAIMKCPYWVVRDHPIWATMKCPYRVVRDHHIRMVRKRNVVGSERVKRRGKVMRKSPLVSAAIYCRSKFGARSTGISSAMCASVLMLSGAHQVI
jgi:hypothetical protein